MQQCRRNLAGVIEVVQRRLGCKIKNERCKQREADCNPKFSELVMLRYCARHHEFYLSWRERIDHSKSRPGIVVEQNQALTPAGRWPTFILTDAFPRLVMRVQIRAQCVPIPRKAPPGGEPDRRLTDQMPRLSQSRSSSKSYTSYQWCTTRFRGTNC